MFPFVEVNLSSSFKICENELHHITAWSVIKWIGGNTYYKTPRIVCCDSSEIRIRYDISNDDKNMWKWKKAIKKNVCVLGEC